MDTIGYTNSSFLMICFSDEEGNEVMELNGSYSDKDYSMRVPNIGEHIILASYEGDYVNDKKAIFRNSYKVVDVITHYLENKKWKRVSVQYSVILKKEHNYF